MATQVTVNGSIYNLPLQGEGAPWGEELSDLIQALVDSSNNNSGIGDILSTSFSVANNIPSATDISGLSFDIAAIRSAIINYSVYRSTNINELSECGVLLITYKSTAGTWDLTRYSTGDAGLLFTITNIGQMQYTSTNLAGTSYSGLIRFSAKSYTQT